MIVVLGGNGSNIKKKEDKIENKDTINDAKKEKINKESEVENKELKKGFFKKVWYSIDKIEKYAELSAEGLKSALKYLAMLILVIGVIAAASTIYKTSLVVNKISQYIDQKVPNLTYSENTLKVENS